mmetsp:Transcript_33393/g.107302  ORF Transcript_33393/g.107302 Transcript_33393/m.107302 type:complete len:375 (-) Transcript_33393:811-1935(-)
MASDATFLLQLGLCDVQGDDAPQQAPPCAGGVASQGLPSHEAAGGPRGPSPTAEGQAAAEAAWQANNNATPSHARRRSTLQVELRVLGLAEGDAAHGEALVAADCLARNMGREQAAYVVSARRQEKGIYGDKADVSSFAIRTGFRALDGVTHRRGTTSTGSRDVDSPWATSRLAQVLQFKAELMLPDEEAQAEADARAEGESFKLEGTRARVRSLADDPLHIIGKGEVVRPRGSWWPNQPAAVRKKTWPCELVGYVSEFKFSNGDKEEMYILSCQGFYYPMRASDVRHLLPQRLLPTGVETSTGRTFRSRRSPGATRSTRSAASAATRASTSTASRSRLAARTTGRSPRAASTRSASHGRRPSTRATAAASSMA